MSPLPPRQPGTALRVLATNDMGARLVPLRASWGENGTCWGVAQLLEEELAAGPAVWLDAGDVTVGPVRALAGETPWADVARLPIAAAAAGNHEFDHGVPALLEGAAALPFPILSAGIDAGLRASTVVETAAGRLGVIGIGHPRNDQLSGGPAPSLGWERRIAPIAAGLRGQGARWVVALLHDGADWWPHADGIATRTRRLERVTAAWAGSVDVILGGHTLGAWSGRLAGTPAGHAHPFAASVLVVDLSPDRAAQVRGWVPVPPVRVAAPSRAIAALDGAAAQIVADNPAPWLSRPDAARYLPRLVARALREASGADAGLAIGSQHATQAPLDGSVAALPAGPVSELDLRLMFDHPDDRPGVVELRRGELRRALALCETAADPRNEAGDDAWWNWGRIPPALDTDCDEPATIALAHGIAPRLGEWIGRELEVERAAGSVRGALARVVEG